MLTAALPGPIAQIVLRPTPTGFFRLAGPFCQCSHASKVLLILVQNSLSTTATKCMHPEVPTSWLRSFNSGLVWMRLLLNLLARIPKSRPYCKQRSAMGLPLRQLVDQLQQIAPLKLAEPWDNVGLLVEPAKEAPVSCVLLTIDLTEDVVSEAVQLGAQLIISYHPNIFRPLKSVTQNSWKERIVVQCIRNNIAVFSPHTTWDSMQGGVNDWLGAALPVGSSKPILVGQEQGVGAGRLITLSEALTVQRVLDLVKGHIGIRHLRLGLGRAGTLESAVRTVALCAGAGTSVLADVQADLYLTGEMTHHDVLEATQRGVHVVLCNHSDSERGYLKVFRGLIASEQLAVHVSQVDRDCLTTI